MTSLNAIGTANAEVIVDELSDIVFTPALEPGTINNFDLLKNLALNVLGEGTDIQYKFNLATNLPTNGVIVFKLPQYAFEQGGTPPVTAGLTIALGAAFADGSI